jgi:nucleotide-binding universal stress UspA family protein
MMPTKGLGKFRRLLFGSVVAKVLHDVDRPVWTSAHHVSPKVTASAGHRSIVCALGRSAHAEAALVLTGVLAKAYGAKICLHYIDEFAEDGVISSVEEMRNASDAANSKDNHGAPNIFAWELADAMPEGIRRVALDEAADLLIVGRGQARGSISRAWSHLYGIIRETPCPVLSV